jgi:hypothetical protein
MALRIVVILGTIASFWAAGGAVAVAQLCDGSIAPISGSDGYKERSGDRRCEGVFVSPVDAKPVELVSLTGGGQLVYPKEGTQRIIVSLLSSAKIDPTRLRAVGIPTGLYYRMDAEVHAGQAIVWPVSDVLLRRNIKAEDVGIFAFRRDVAGQPVYVPVNLSPHQDTTPTNEDVLVTLRVQNSISEVRWRFSAASAPSKGWQVVPVANGRAFLRLPPRATGALDLLWNDPTTGVERTGHMLIGS